MSAWGFETERLLVGSWHDTPFSSPHVASLEELVCDLLTPGVTASLPEDWRGPYSRSRAAAWIEDRDAESAVLLSVQRGTLDPVGLILVHEAGTDLRALEELRIGYLIRESHWGHGYASELIGGLVRRARARDAGTILAGVERDNRPSIRVLEKCGFTQAQSNQSSSDELLFRIVL